MDELIEILRYGGTFVYPTATIWGIGCDATNAEAIQKIYKIKQREASKSMIILVESERRLQSLVDVPSLAWDIMDLSEKPVTIVYDHPRGLPKELLAPDGSIGIRLTKNDYCKRVISRLNRPIVSTSANLSGDKSPRRFADINPKILEQVDYVCPDFHEVVSKFSGSSVIRVGANNEVQVLRE